MNAMSKATRQYGRQDIADEDITAVTEVLRSDFLTQGPALERFEEALAKYVGARHAIAVSSGTAALHVACLAAGMGPGKRGVTQTLSFVASANCVLYCNGEVDLCDVDAYGLGMSPAGLANLIERRGPRTWAKYVLFWINFLLTCHALFALFWSKRYREILGDSFEVVCAAFIVIFGFLLVTYVRRNRLFAG